MSAIPDPEHNAKMLALIKARELAPSRSWIEDHPFALPANFERIRHDQRIIDSIIRLNHRHFLETGNPLFCIRALLQTGMGMPDDSQLDWVSKWLDNALGQLNALTDRPKPPENGEHWAILRALGFSTDRYSKPLSEVRQIIEKDKIYVTVLLHGKPVTGAFQNVADKFGLSYSKVRKIYYDMKKLVDSLPP